MAGLPKPIEHRFWQKVIDDEATGCWIWTGNLRPDGYGRISYGTRESRVEVVAHRWAYEWIIGKIPARLELDHLCRNRACVNPAHLEPVTTRENLFRGNGWSGRHARKTHCPKGHRLSGTNLSRYHLKHRQRKCLRCHADRERARKARARSKPVAKPEQRTAEAA